ncbi:MAG: CPBP family intramembrane metalloprotease, partial [Chloroflexi bacterium]|nr:CPBP family intramembrane metalloprotease [Chloroflexota bacterium]
TLNRLAHQEVSVWYWRVRFFRELQQEEFEVWLDPTGRVVAFRHEVPEAAPGASLTSDGALEVAQRYLIQDRGIPLDNYRLVTSSQEVRPNRVDHTFEWERAGYRLGEATYRLRVTIAGSGVDSFREYLKVPEEWLRQWQEESTRGWLMTQAGWAASFGLAIVLVYVFLIQVRAGALRWRFPATMAAILILILTAASLNSIPLILASYPTTSPLLSFLITELVNALAGWAPQGAVAVLAGIVGLGLAYRATGAAQPLESLPRGQALLAVPLVRAVGVGYAMAGVWLGYVVLFYWVGTRFFGVWSPVEVPYSDVMSTFLPAIYPMTIGAGAAISEEFVYRLFAVSFFLIVFRGLASGVWGRRLATALALLLPAAIWASLHAAYPQQPFFVRPIELTVVGVVSGLIFLRYGVAATMLSHYLYNASIVGGLFLLSGSRYLQISALVAIALPALLLIPASLRRLRGQALLPQEPVTLPSPTAQVEISEALAPSPPAVSLPTHWPTFPPRRAVLLVASALASLALLPAATPAHLGDSNRLAVDRWRAQEMADEQLRFLGGDPTEWLRSVAFVNAATGNDATYLLRQLGTAGADQALAKWVRPYFWEVRYFRSLEKEEVLVRVDGEGRFQGFVHRRPEESPGAELSKAEARSLAESFVAQRLGSMDELRLITASSQQRPARVDHTFVWEWEKGSVGEGSSWLAVTVAGNEVSSYQPFFKTPETFDRELAGQSMAKVAFDGLKGIAWFALIAMFAVALVLRFRAGLISVRFPMVVAALVVAIESVGRLNGLPALYRGYWTTISTTNYLFWQAIGAFTGLLVLFVVVWALAALGESLYRERFSHVPLGQIWGRRRQWALAAFVGLCLAPVGLLGQAIADRLRDSLARPFLTPMATFDFDRLSGLLPAIASLSANLSTTILLSLAAGVAFLILWRLLRRPWLAGIAWILGAGLLGMGAAPEWQGMALQGLFWAAAASLALLAAWWLLRLAPLAYIMAPFLFLTLRDGAGLVFQPDAFFAANGWALIAVSLAPLLAAFSLPKPTSVP